MAENRQEVPGAATEKPRFTARLRFARISARKLRYVADLIRGKDYNTAIAILRTCPKRGAPFCKKLLESAFGNAAETARARNWDLDGNRLHIVEIRVDPGPILKRWRPSSVRRPYPIKKRLCHLFVALQEREPRESRRQRAKRRQQERMKKASPAPAAPAGGGVPAGGEPAQKKEEKA